MAPEHHRELANSATDVKGTSEESIAKVILMDERNRLGIVAKSDEISTMDGESIATN